MKENLGHFHEFDDRALHCRYICYY